MYNRMRRVRVFLLICLIAASFFAFYSIYYKVSHWGFSPNYKSLSDIWTIEAQISFIPTDRPISISMARPISSQDFSILSEDVIAKKYKVDKTDTRMTVTSAPRKKRTTETIYYRIMLYKNGGISDFSDDTVPLPAPPPPVLSEQTARVSRQILDLSKSYSGNRIQQIIGVFAQTPPDPVIQTFLPERQTPRERADTISTLLALEGIPHRIVRGFKLVEGRKNFSADIMIEAETGETVDLYNIDTTVKGTPDNFIVFQRTGNSIVDVEGGIDSAVRFSVIKSVRAAMNLAEHRSKHYKEPKLFSYKYSVYNLPIDQQNSLKWLMIFPLAILIIVVMRNVIGMKTMGTFTPMLISMTLVETGFWIGLLCFTIIVGAGLLVRSLLTRFNLLLVPRISSVVIFVILIIQMFTVYGYHAHLSISASALFFPIIIMAWVIERTSITWEEEGMRNALREIVNTLIVSVITYFIISNATIRHLMFAFNELNLILLCLVMLLGTYTGYRLTELFRFASIARQKQSAKRRKRV